MASATSSVHEDGRLAAELAVATGELLIALRREHIGDAEDLRDTGDRVAQSHLAAELARHRPQDVVLSEEAADDRRRLQADRVWIIDPLDGTRDYGAGRAEWAVHVALWADGDLVAGAVALPDRGVVLDSVAPRPLPSPHDPLRVAVSRHRAAGLTGRAIELLGADQVHLGSAGYKVGALLLGEADVYLHAGGQFEWDSAAPVVVARAAGLHTSRIDGSPLRYNQSEVYLPDLLVCHPQHAKAALAAVERAEQEQSQHPR